MTCILIRQLDSKLLRYVPVLSRSALDLEVMRYIADVFLNEQPNSANCFVNACGSDKMIRSSCEILVKFVIEKRSSFRCIFTASAPL